MAERKNHQRKQTNEDAPLTLTKVKKQIRGIDRQLKNRRDKMPANVIVEKERALKAFRTQLVDLENAQKVKLLTQKYKMVRFLEKQKTRRAYKAALKQYNETEEQFKENENDKELKKQLKKLRKQLHHCEIDLAYNANFPYDKKYISLFPKKVDEAEIDENVKKGMLKTDNERNSFKREIEEKLKEGTLDLSIEDILSGKSDKNILSKNLNEDIETSNDPNEEFDEEDDFFE